MDQPTALALAREVARLRRVELERAVEVFNPVPPGRMPVRVPWPPAWVAQPVPLEEWVMRLPLATLRRRDREAERSASAPAADNVTRR